jgi:hypothetical protein
MMKTESPSSPEFIKAISDYCNLMDRGYPEKGSLKLVGDRYRLSSELRTILYRGICSSAKATSRKRRIITDASGTLAIDGYNVLFTLLNYRLGRLVFISNDGICRDAGSLFGKVLDRRLFNECMVLLLEYLKNSAKMEIRIYLDTPVSNSHQHREYLSKIAKSTGISLSIILTESADQALLEDPSGLIASSDSDIIDSTEKSILDIPKCLLQKRYHAVMIDLEALIH